MRVLVTGAAGFLGSHFCDLLLERGYDVIAMDDFITGTWDNILHLTASRRFRFVHHDVTEETYIDGPLVAVAHLASPASPEAYARYPIETLRAGALGTHKMLGVSKRKKCRFLLASTSEVYGDPQVHPQPEEYWGHVNPIGPRSMYDEAKRFAEALTVAYHHQHGIDTKIARIFNTYGPRMRLDDGRVFSNFIRQALRGEPVTVYGDGKQTRSFCFVSDTVEGLYRLLHSSHHGPINLGNPEETSILDLARVVISVTQSPSTILFQPAPGDDPRVRRPDITRARSLLEWEPTVSLSEGIRLSLPYFQDKIAEADLYSGA